MLSPLNLELQLVQWPKSRQREYKRVWKTGKKFSEAGWYKRRIVSVIENSGENYTTAMTSYIIRQNGLINLLLYKKTFMEIIAVC
jgi:hypothetical protein